jgi:hypothetical protein
LQQLRQLDPVMTDAILVKILAKLPNQAGGPVLGF